AYHGGVIKFPEGGSVLNVPFDYLLADYNDTEGTEEAIRRAGDELAAVIVEPILGAGGSIPGTKEFFEMLRQTTRDVGALLIFDEVKTARLGPAGVQGMLGIVPDLTMLGKIIAGGLPTGAFGGKAAFMAPYNPQQAGSWKHAGTFNNNVCSMAAGIAAFGQIFTPQRAADFFEWSEAFRNSLNRMFAEKGVPMFCNGLGSMFCIHFVREPFQRMAVRSSTSQSLSALLHMELLLAGVLVCSRGDMFLSLPMTDGHLTKARESLEDFIDRYKPLITSIVES
ncbi:MAG: aminotransferase class III-fold pyridoxal phosphate-dependent enzyme, partial [Aeoliella sp.]